MRADLSDEALGAVLAGADQAWMEDHSVTQKSALGEPAQQPRAAYMAAAVREAVIDALAEGVDVASMTIERGSALLDEWQDSLGDEPLRTGNAAAHFAVFVVRRTAAHLAAQHAAQVAGLRDAATDLLRCTLSSDEARLLIRTVGGITPAAQALIARTDRISPAAERLRTVLASLTAAVARIEAEAGLRRALEAWIAASDAYAAHYEACEVDPECCRECLQLKTVENSARHEAGKVLATPDPAAERLLAEARLGRAYERECTLGSVSTFPPNRLEAWHAYKAASAETEDALAALRALGGGGDG